MDLESMKLAFQVLQFLLTGGLMVYVHLINKDKVTNDRIERLEDDLHTDLAHQGERIAKLESHSGTAPNHADIAKVYESVNHLSITVHQLVGENRAQSDTLKLILNQITVKGMQ